MAHSRGWRPYAACLVCGLATCALWFFAMAPSTSRGPQLPSSIFLIPDSEMGSVLKDANSNDLKAIRKLIDHFERSGGHVAEAAVWRERARSLGDATELRLHASELYMRAMYAQVDMPEKQRLLIAAMESANLSRKREDSDATRKLIGSIQAELDRLGQRKSVGQ